ncbi:MAG TPA: pyruvate kinase, partial [Acidobacteriota bacterium]|nr:pyruvate kinase [Acidobacteriota bacterium]
MSKDRFNPPYRLVLRRTRIVATIGPASESPEVLQKLVSAGLNVARLNFSHGTHDKHLVVINRIRKIIEDTGTRVAMLGDLSGPKTRVGKFETGSIELRQDQEVKIVTGSTQPGRDGIIPSQYAELIQDVMPGQRILMDDGLLEIVITRIENDHEAIAKVVKGGTLKNNKGMNLPGAKMSVPAITPKDLEDLDFAIKNRLDYVALSFVRKAKEIIELKERILNLTHIHYPELFKDQTQPAVTTRVIAKIEKPEALDEIPEIVEEADGIMIARGDLGVELPPEQVPIVQTQLILTANERNKPVIVATQMLESMIENPRPTRAEVNDVATAVRDRTDAVMLSGETAAGMYPVESVEMMNRIIREIETYQWSHGRWGKLRETVSISPLPNALARACTLLSHDMEIRAINVLTRTGRVARIMSAARPTCPILAYANDPIVVKQMQMLWGVFPIQIEQDLTFEAFAGVAAETCKNMGIAQSGNHILL